MLPQDCVPNRTVVIEWEIRGTVFPNLSHPPYLAPLTRGKRPTKSARVDRVVCARGFERWSNTLELHVRNAHDATIWSQGGRYWRNWALPVSVEEVFVIWQSNLAYIGTFERVQE
jgi:hypothetical protein